VQKFVTTAKAEPSEVPYVEPEQFADDRQLANEAAGIYKEPSVRTIKEQCNDPHRIKDTASAPETLSGVLR